MVGRGGQLCDQRLRRQFDMVSDTVVKSYFFSSNRPFSIFLPKQFHTSKLEKLSFLEYLYARMLKNNWLFLHNLVGKKWKNNLLSKPNWDT